MESTAVPTSPSIPVSEQPPVASVTKGDKHIWGIYILLCLISIIELYSASSREVASSSMGVFGPIVRHTAMLLIGFVIILFVQRMHYRKFILYIPLFVMLSIGAMIYTLIAGDIINGARRSFTLIGFTVTPSELLKLSAALIIALVMSRSQIKGGVKNGGIIACAVIILLFGALLIKEGMTNTILLMAISLSMMVIGGVEWRKFFLVIAVYMVFVVIFLAFDSHSSDSATAQAVTTEQVVRDSEPEKTTGRLGTWKARINRFLGNGEPKYKEELNAKNRQEQYAYMAQANGGIFGVFPGNSRETARLPLAFSDFIYSIIVEDMGLMGGVVVLILYLWLLARASAIASRCSRAFPALLVIGMAVMIVFQALFHMAIVSGFFPVSGQPLPLISKGGTSILITSLAFGVMLSVSRYAVRNGKKQDIKNEINSLPEDVRAENPTMLKR